MKPRIAITRAQPGLDETAARVRALGGDPIAAPLLEIKSIGFDASLAGVQALAFTSANGVRAFAHASAERNTPVLTVGDATAEAARAAGFADVRSADGDVAALTALVQTELSPRGGAVLHIAGEHVSGDLSGDLRAAGFEAERRTAYTSRAVAELPAALSKPLDIVLFHSARAARVFMQFGAPGADALTAACLSPAIAEAASAAPWRTLIVAPAPREADLLAALPRLPDSPAGASA